MIGIPGGASLADALGHRRTALRPKPAGRFHVLPGIALMLTLLVGGAAVAAPLDENDVISPNASTQKASPPAGTGTGALTAVAVIVLAGAGGWMLWRGKAGALSPLNRAPRKLAVEETRSLGNRQFLVVATYQEKKFLLGVCPGRIDLLAPLNESTPPVEKRP